MKKKYIVLLFSCFICLLSCTRKYDFSYEKSISEKVLEDLQTKKIIFIGENHLDVYPVVFMTQHIRDFYKAGVRYIFLEGGFPRLAQTTTDKEYSFLITNPYIQIGWKYEDNNFEESILQINCENEADPIKIIFPEKELTSFEQYLNEDISELLNYRDYHIQKKVIDILENSKPEEKAIVFYGSSHGWKINQTVESNSSEWKATGVYLYEYYNELFTNYDIEFIYPPFQKFYNFNEETAICLSEKNKRVLFKRDKNFITAYDNVCLTKKIVYGVPYAYIPTNENLIFLLHKAKEVCQQKNEIKNDNSRLSKTKNKETYVLINYYLKYLFGDNYDYDLTNPDKEMEHALKKLEENCFNNKNPSDYVCVNYPLEELERYMFYLFCDGSIEDKCLNSDFKKDIDFELNSLIQAKLINSRDIWPQYWISYFETEKAKSSKRKIDYEKALKDWNELLNNEIVYASPILKIVYKKMAYCEEQLGNFEKQDLYIKQEFNVRDEIQFDYETYKYFGY